MAKNKLLIDFEELEKETEYEIEALKVEETETTKELLQLKREIRDINYKLQDCMFLFNNNIKIEHVENKEDINIAFNILNNTIKKLTLIDKNILETIKTFEKPISYAFNLQKTQVKKFINVEDFEQIFGFSKSSQQNFRSRLYNPIPFLQPKKKGKIIYELEKVKDWLSNNK